MVEGTPLLSTPRWLPDSPIALDDIELQYAPGAAFVGITGSDPALQRLLPVRADGTRYRTYSDAVSALAAPGIFDNRSTYRLLSADLQSGPRMVFGCGSYFDGIDVSDAFAHEFTAVILGEITTQDLRAAIGEPCDSTRRPVNVALSTLTLRRDRSTGAVTFPLHRRDGAAVAHAGGLYQQVLPVGIFQPAGEQPWHTGNDFSLWRCIVRELAEELRGEAGGHGTDRGPIDYDAWPFAHRLTPALDTAQVRAFCLGVGVDPLTFATDILTVVTIDAPIYDELFGTVGAINAEGSILPAVPFSAQAVEQYASTEPTQAAGCGPPAARVAAPPEPAHLNCRGLSTTSMSGSTRTCWPSGSGEPGARARSAGCGSATDACRGVPSPQLVGPALRRFAHGDRHAE